MEIQLVEMILGIVVSIVGYYVREHRMEMKKIKDELTELRIDKAENCLTRNELSILATSWKEDIRDIISPLANKVQSIEEFLRQKPTH